MLIRSRCVLPISSPPIDNGAVEIRGDRIVAVGKWNQFHTSRADIDLGDSILLPGLINAHCHLDYTDMAGQIPRPKQFPDWIKSLLALKAHWSYSDYAQSWLNGAGMLLRSGVTAVADVEAVPELLPEAWSATPLRVFSFIEMTGVKSGRPPSEIIRETETLITSLPQKLEPTGLSPHAPYSTSPELLRLSARLAAQRNWRIVTHVAESQPEFDMFEHRCGPLFNWLKSQRNMADCGAVSPLQHLDRCGLLGSNLLAVHVNYLRAGEPELLSHRGVTVVHCPRSHRYFQHAPFPREPLLAAKVNLCIGTDSLASTLAPRRQKPELSLFPEMQLLAETAPDLSPKTIVKMVTRNPAQALGMDGLLGQLSPGSYADLISVPWPGVTEDPYAQVVAHSGPVASVMINGRWRIAPE